MAPNFGVGQFWSKQSHKGTSVVVKMENPNYSMLELESPADGFQVNKGGRGKNAKQLTWVLLLKAHKAAGCLAWLANGVWALFASVRRRFTAPSDESGKSPQKSKLYRVIRCFLIASILLLGFELLAYWKGWHFSRPNLYISPSLSINGLLEYIYSGWLYTRANYLAPPLQYLANVCIILFLIQSADRALLCVGCFWIKLKKIKPVPKCELGDAADLEQGDNAAYPMVLVQMPMCNEREVYQQSIAAVCNLDWPKDHMLVQVLDDSDDGEVQFLIAAEVQKWQQKGVHIVYRHRVVRTGYKAGNLKSAMNCDYVKDYEFVAIFDADFRPDPDFLKRTVPHFKDNDELALVQGRWSFVNRDENLLTRLQYINLSFHFEVEQQVNSVFVNFFGFNGTTGVWRIKALEESGGWLERTTVEDMDIAVRAHLNGWKFIFPDDVKGLILVTLSASLRSLHQSWIFFFSIYLVALGQGGHKPCLQAFGADQFEDGDPVEKKYKSSFFNYWYWGICFGTLLGVTVLLYIQDNVGWGLGFGIPAVTMVIALFAFLCGTRFYRHKLPDGSPLTRIVHVFVATFHKWNVSSPPQEEKKVAVAAESEVLKLGSRRQYLPTDQFKFLDKATVEDELDYECKTTTRNWRLCSVQDVEEVKAVLGLSPIWMSCLTFGIVFSQSATFFTKQGDTMDRKIGKHFEIPPASLQSFIDLSIILLLPVYDRIFVPIARSWTGNERGITLLQRIGTGLFISFLSMIVAALTEIRRIKAAKDNGLIDMPKATIPLSISLLLPQYILFGIADVFTMVGMQEYFYDQMPDSMKSLGIAVYLSVLGIGSFLSSILISVIEKLSCRNKGGCWFANNLNKAHLDYYYWFLASLSAINLCMYMFLANRYKYKYAQNNILYQ